MNRLILCFVLAFQLLGVETLPHLLNDYLSSMVLFPGKGHGRGLDDVRSGAGGTHLELTMGFRDILAANGIASELIQGRIQLNDLQWKEFSPVDYSRFKSFLGEEDNLEYSWLRVMAPALPDFMTRSAAHSSNAVTEVDIFPALTGVCEPAFDAEKVFALREAENLERQLRCEIQWSDNDNALVYFPLDVLDDNLKLCYANWRDSDIEMLGTHKIGIVGGRSMAIGTKIAKILEQRTVAGYSEKAVLGKDAATIEIVLRDNGGELLKYIGEQLLCEKTIELKWSWLNDGSDIAEGDIVVGKRMSPKLIINGELYSAARGCMPESMLQLSICRKTASECITDVQELDLISGTELKLAFSGGHQIKNGDLSENETDVLWRSMLDGALEASDLAMSIVTACNLQAMATAKEPVYSYIGKERFKLKAFTESIRFFEEDVDFAQRRECSSSLDIGKCRYMRSLMQMAVLGAMSHLKDNGNDRNILDAFYTAIKNKSDKIKRWKGDGKNLPDYLVKGTLSDEIKEAGSLISYYLDDNESEYAIVLSQCRSWLLSRTAGVQHWIDRCVKGSQSLCEPPFVDLKLVVPACVLSSELLRNCRDDNCDLAVVYAFGEIQRQLLNSPQIIFFRTDVSDREKKRWLDFAFAGENVKEWNVTVSKNGKCIFERSENGCEAEFTAALEEYEHLLQDTDFDVELKLKNGNAVISVNSTINIQGENTEAQKDELAVELIIEGLDAKRRIVSSDFTTVTWLEQEVPYLALSLDGEIIAEDVNCYALASYCKVDGWEERRHFLKAIAYGNDGEIIGSNEMNFFYSPWADDNISPVIECTFSEWPPVAKNFIDIIASDAGGVYEMSVYSGDNEIWSKKSDKPEGESIISARKLEISAALLASGVCVSAFDVSGNSVMRILKYGGTESEILHPVLQSEAFDGMEHSGTISLWATVPERGVSALQLIINSIVWKTCFFPEDEVIVFNVPEMEWLDGRNSVQLAAWNPAGDVFYSNISTVKTPVFKNYSVGPLILSPWRGTEDKLSIQAEMKQEHDWIVILEGGGISRKIQGHGNSIEQLMEVGEMPDGEYFLTIDVPELEFTKTFDVEIDFIRGMPVAEISSIGEGEVVDTGIVKVWGTAKNSEDNSTVSYWLELRDESGKRYAFERHGLDGMELFALPDISLETSLNNPVCETVVIDNELACLDMSILPNGTYTITLFVEYLEQVKTAEYTFFLDTNLKAGYFSFNEEDFQVNAGPVTLVMKRNYSTQHLDNNGFGYGWTHSMDGMKPVIDEKRSEVKDIFGAKISVRSGGTRDVTLTLSNGKRVTFKFSLEEGGGWSFCYYACWTPPKGINATLTPVCSDKLMALPGLNVYWEAAGMSTPWERFDFPGFVLTEENGMEYQIEREYLGDANWLEGGEECFADVYGDLKVMEIKRPDGKIVRFEDDCIVGVFEDGTEEYVMRFTRDENGRVKRSEVLQGRTVAVEYEYDEIGNLVSTYRSEDGAELELHHVFEYGMAKYPHHITSVRKADGTILMNVNYDQRGSVSMIGGADGNGITSQNDSFNGFNITRDALGRETLVYYDNKGNVTSTIKPNGAVNKFEYDDLGREICSVDAMGNKTMRNYDSYGNVLEHVNALGEKKTFSYNGGKCSRVVDEIGRVSNYDYSSDGMMSSISTEEGLKISLDVAKDRNIRLIKDANSGIAVRNSYDERGRLICSNSDEGLQFTIDYNSDNKPTRQNCIYFHPVTQEEVAVSASFGYDSEGRQVYMALSDGSWVENEYDANGRLSFINDSDNEWTRKWYDAGGRISQELSSNGNVVRYVYDLAGRIVLATSPMHTPDCLEAGGFTSLLSFSNAVKYIYDDGDNVVGEVLLDEAAIKLVNTGNDCYEAVLIEANEAGKSEKAFDLNGNCLKSRTYEGVETAYEYDALGRCISVTDQWGARQVTHYGKGGLLEKVVAPDGNETHYSYSKYGRLEKVKYANGAIWSFSNDYEGNIVSYANPFGCETVFQRNCENLITGVVLPGDKNARFMYEYDAVLGLSAIIMPDNKRFAFENDELGRRCRELLPMGQVKEYAYCGTEMRLENKKDFNGGVCSYEYDAYKRPVAVCYSAEKSEYAPKKYRIDYDDLGHKGTISLIEDGKIKAETVIDYDKMGRMAHQTVDGCKIEYSYNLDGLLKSVDIDGTAVKFERSDSERKVTAVYSALDGQDANLVFEYYYDVCNRLTKVKRADGSTKILNYDAVGAVVEIREISSSGEEIASFSCIRDLAGRIVEEKQKWPNGDRNILWNYDACGRITAEISTGSHENLCYSMAMGYDECGRRKTVHVISANGGSITKEFSYDGNGRMMEIASSGDESCRQTLNWDDNGSLISIVPDGNEAMATRFFWDVEGKLRRVFGKKDNGTFECIYDYRADGTLRSLHNAIETNDGRQEHSYSYLYASNGEDFMPRLQQEIAQDGDGNILWKRNYVWSNGLTAVLIDGKECNVLCDLRGNVCRMDLENSGVMHAFDCWGEKLLGKNAESAACGFKGELTDDLSGLVYMRSRFYSPELGIFISADEAEPCLSSPSSIDKYAFCINDPVNLNDPMGTSVLGFVLGNIVSTLCMFPQTLSLTNALDGLLYEAVISRYNLYLLELSSKSYNNATVVVHGVAKHLPGHDDDFISELTKKAPRQDYYSFLWSGFGTMFIVPSVLHHKYALRSFAVYTKELEAMGYEKFNFLSHSWGTMLSRDGLNAWNRDIGLWVTMGSPLVTCSPKFSYENWINFYCPNDPVVDLCFDNAWMDGNLKKPLYTSSIPLQIMLHCDSWLQAHSSYWSSPVVIKSIGFTLNKQQ